LLPSHTWVRAHGSINWVLPSLAMRPVTSSPDVRQKEGNVSLLPPNTVLLHGNWQNDQLIVVAFD
jgi:hypothetical protein